MTAKPTLHKFATIVVGGRMLTGGPGKAGIDGDALLLKLSGLRLGGGTIRIPVQEIEDVVADDFCLTLMWRQPGGKLVKYFLVAKAKGHAEQIAAALPSTRTPDIEAKIAANNVRREQFRLAVGDVSKPSLACSILIAINFLIYLAFGFSGGGWISADADRLLAWGGDHWVVTTGGEWWRLLSSAFLHGGLLHIALNMYILFDLGRLVERAYGIGHFLVIYFGGALVSGLTSIWWSHDVVVIGASGAVFAVCGALMALAIRKQRDFPAGVGQRLLNEAVLFIIYNVLFALQVGGLSHAGHLGGLVVGFSLGFAMARGFEEPSRSESAKPTLMRGLGTALALFVLAVVGIPKSGIRYAPELEFRRELTAMGSKEEALLKRFDEICGRFDARDINGAEGAALIEREVIPAWEAMTRGFSSIRLSDKSPTLHLAQVVSHSSAMRRDLFREIGAGMAAFDAGEHNVFDQRMEVATKMRQELEQYIGSEVAVAAAEAGGLLNGGK